MNRTVAEDCNFDTVVVEAKAKYKTADEGLKQAIDYARILDVKFAYSTSVGYAQCEKGAEMELN